MIALSDYECPVDQVMGHVTLDYRGRFVRDMELTPCHPEVADMIFEYRDRSNDEAEETLREESEYWHGMSEVGPEWFFELE